MPKAKDPDEIVHAQVAEGETVVYKNISYGPARHAQARRGDLDRLASTPRSTLRRSPTWQAGSR